MRQSRRTEAQRVASLAFSRVIRGEVNARKVVQTNGMKQENADVNDFFRGLKTRPRMSDGQESDGDNAQENEA